MANRDAMLALRLVGYTYQEIGERFKVSRQRVQQVLSPKPAVRDAVVERADGECENCGLRVGVGGHVHHVDSIGFDVYSSFNGLDNLQLLCVGCHRAEHSGLLDRNPYLWEGGKGYRPAQSRFDAWDRRQARRNDGGPGANGRKGKG